MFIAKEVVENCLYLDVETVGIEKDFETLQEKNPRLAKLWEKRAEYYIASKKSYEFASPSAIFRDRAGLEPEFSRIVCVSFGTFDKNSPDGMKLFSVYDEEETDLLNKVNKILNNALAKNWQLCGHNLKAFDIPCIGKRMLYNRIEPSSNLRVYGKKPWEINFLDTADIFSFGSWQMQKTLSLDLLTCSMGIPSPKGKMDGSLVSPFYYSGNIKDIVKYCEDDVIAVMKVMKSLLF